MATTLSDVSSLFGANASSLLTTLYGLAGRSAVPRQNPATALATAERDEARNVTLTAAEPVVKRAVDAFTAGVNGAKTVQELLANPAVMQVLLTAGGLSDQTPYTALARKALQSQLSDPKSLANTLSDTRWKQVVQTYDFANKGLSVIKQPAVIGTIANAYAEVTWRKSLDAKTPGLSNALAFRKEASTITSVDQILGDPVMRNVVTVALGIPLQIAFQTLEAQEKAVSTRLDINRLKDPKFVESFVQRYLIAAGSNATDATATPDLMSLAVRSRGLVV